MALTSTINLSVSAQQTLARDLCTASAPLSLTYTNPLATGTGAGKADLIFSDTFTISASANTELDLNSLAGGALGETSAFVAVKAIIVTALAANTNSIVIGNASATQFLGPLGAAVHTVAVPPGGMFAVSRSDATGWTVSGTVKLLRLANSSSGTSVTGSIIIIGASA